MPALYFNSEVGTCTNEKHALHCISRTLDAYGEVKKHVSFLCQQQNTFSNFCLCSEQGKSIFFSELMHRLTPHKRTLAILLLQELSKGFVVTPPENYEKTLKSLDIPSPLLEYILNQNGMALSFATNEYWERDFIEFNECDEVVPNVWGQVTFDSFNEWIRQYHNANGTLFSKIQNDFNIHFCDDGITENAFSLWEWRLIYNSFQKASLLNFEVTQPLISSWDNLPIFYIRDRNHSSFTIRIFFIKQNEKIYVGKIYHKNETNTLKEERAADCSYKMFCDLELL